MSIASSTNAKSYGSRRSGAVRMAASFSIENGVSSDIYVPRFEELEPRKVPRAIARDGNPFHLYKPCRATDCALHDENGQERKPFAKVLIHRCKIRGIAEIDDHIHHVRQARRAGRQQGSNIVERVFELAHDISRVHHPPQIINTGRSRNEAMRP